MLIFLANHLIFEIIVSQLGQYLHNMFMVFCLPNNINEILNIQQEPRIRFTALKAL